MQPCDHMTENNTVTTNEGIIAHWTMLRVSMDVQLFCRLYSYLCNVPLYVVRDVWLIIKLTNARPSFYLMNKTAD
jgi:hypothetical protein